MNLDVSWETILSYYVKMMETMMEGERLPIHLIARQDSTGCPVGTDPLAYKNPCRANKKIPDLCPGIEFLQLLAEQVFDILPRE